MSELAKLQFTVISKLCVVNISVVSVPTKAAFGKLVACANDSHFSGKFGKFQNRKIAKSSLLKDLAIAVELNSYPEPGSNRHGLPHWCLRPARLPIPPSGLFTAAKV